VGEIGGGSGEPPPIYNFATLLGLTRCQGGKVIVWQNDMGSGCETAIVQPSRVIKSKSFSWIGALRQMQVASGSNAQGGRGRGKKSRCTLTPEQFGTLKNCYIS